MMVFPIWIELANMAGQPMFSLIPITIITIGLIRITQPHSSWASALAFGGIGDGEPALGPAA